MRLLISTFTRYYRLADGTIWTRDYGRDMWQEYQEVFSHLSVFARVLRTATPPVGSKRADGAGIEYVALPEWNTLLFPVTWPRICLLYTSEAETVQ